MNYRLVRHQVRGDSVLALATIIFVVTSLGVFIGPKLLCQEAFASEISQPRGDSDATDWFAYGLSLYQKGEYQQAKTAFEKTLQLGSEHVNAAQWLSRTQSKIWMSRVQTGNQVPSSAEQVAVQKSAPLEPLPAPRKKNGEEEARQSSIKQLYRAAKVLFKGGDYEGANSKLKQLLAIEPNHKDAKELLRKSMGKAAQAVEETRLAKEKADKQARQKDNQNAIKALVSEGNAAMKGKDYRAAIGKFQQARDLDPQNRKLKSLYAKANSALTKQERNARLAQDNMAKQQQDNKIKAEREQRIAAEREAKRQEKVNKEKAREMAKQQKAEKARLKREMAANKKAEEARVKREMAAAKKAAKQDGKAKVEKTEIASAKPEPDPTPVKQQQVKELLSQAFRLVKADRWDEAEKSYQAVLKLDPENKKANKGLASVEKGRVKWAKKRNEQLAKEKEELRRRELEANKQQITEQLDLAKSYTKQGRLDQSETAYKRVLQLDPENKEAEKGLSGLDKEREKKAVATAKEAEATAKELKKVNQEKTEMLVEEGLKLHAAGNVVAAVAKWEEVQTLVPGESRSAMYLQQYRAEAEHATIMKEQEALDTKYKREYDSALGKSAPDISYPHPVGGDVRTILDDLSQVCGLNFVIGEGVEGIVFLSLSGKTIGEILEEILVPNGFKYERIRNTVYVSTDYDSQVFPLNPKQYDIIKRMLDDPTSTVPDQTQTLQWLLYGEKMATPKGKLLKLNPTHSTLIVTDSKSKIDKVKAFLDDLDVKFEGASPYIERLFLLDPTVSKQLFEVVKFTLYPTIGPMPGIGVENRRMLMLKDDMPDMHILLIRDTSQNIEKVEKILNDRELRDNFARKRLEAKSFRVTYETPEKDDEEGKERVASMTRFAYDTLKFMLYGEGGTDDAEKAGRRIMIHRDDEQLGAIDVIDYPDNLKRVENYLNSILGEIGTVDQIRSYKIRSGNLTEVTDVIIKILMGFDAETRRLFLSQNTLGNVQSNSQQVSAQGGGSIQGVTFQGGQQQLQAGGQGMYPTELVYEGTLDEYDALFYPDVITQQLFVRARDPILFERIQSLIDVLDIVPKMVEIETRMVEVTLTELRNVGIDWSLLSPGRSSIDLTDFDNNDLTVDLLNNVSPQGALLSFATLGESQLQMTLSLINTLDSAEVLSAPRIVTRSHPTLMPTIDVTTQLPYISRARINTRNDDDPTNNQLEIDYAIVPIGVRSSVYPMVTADNHVYLDIRPQIAVVTDRLPVIPTSQGSTGGDDSTGGSQFGDLGTPVIDVRTSSNQVVLADGETVVLGGFIRDEMQLGEKRVPLLSRMPLLGGLFRNTSKTKSKRTLLIFVTVNVLQAR
jgi:type II secretory pathway component GspD/PulD (secretin)